MMRSRHRFERRLAPLAAVVLLGISGCGGDDVEANTAPDRLTVQVMRGNLVIRAEATGQIEPVRRVEVKSKASGEILTLHVDVGDEVERGALLAEIDPRDVRNSYNQVQADLEVARARAEISAAQLERSRQLFEAEVITQQEYENARLDYSNAQASLIRSETNFELAELQLLDVSIRAPMDGTVLAKNVEEGAVIQSASQNVSGGSVLFTMADLGEMQVRTLVDETDMGLLRAGMSATVTVEAFPDRNFVGSIQTIEPQAVVEQNVTMFPVIVQLDNSSGLLRPGMNAEVEFFIDEARDVLMVPNNAIVSAEDVGPAAMALGLDIESLDLSPFMAVGGGGFSRGGNGGGGFATGGGQRSGGGGGQDMARIQELRQQVESGALSQDSLRSIMQGMRAQGGGVAPRAGGEGEDPMAETRPGAVFVIGPDGTPEPRMVQIGLGDWDNTQVTGDIQEGDRLALVGAAQLQAQQEEWLDRMRDRMGGSSPFGGGAPGGGFRGRGRF